MAIDTGNTAFMLVCTSLVMLMTPGLAFFYGGLVGRKNVLAIMIQSFVSMGWTTVIWFAFGYSMCFGPSLGGFIGDPTYYAFLNNITLASCPQLCRKHPHTTADKQILPFLCKRLIMTVLMDDIAFYCTQIFLPLTFQVN